MTGQKEQFDDSMSMEELLNSAPDVEQGKILTGEIVSVDDRYAYVNIGGKVDGRVFLNEFERTPEIGERYDVLVKSNRLTEGMYALSRKAAVAQERWKKFEKWAETGHETVSGRLLKRVNNGAIIEFDGVTGFLPMKEAGDIRFKDETSFSREYDFKVIEIDHSRKNVVLSRKVFVDEIKNRAWDEISEKYKEGDTVSGTVSSFADFGTFVDLNGYEALLHNNDLSWSKGIKRKSLLKIGDSAQFRILSIDRENRKIALGLKQMTEDPWESVVRRYAVGSKIEGTVTTVTSFGIFVELEPGIEGLVSSSEISWTRKMVNPKETYSRDMKVSAVILDINTTDRRISLSIKQAERNPIEQLGEQYSEGTIVDATVARIASFGVFVNLAPDVDGLVHISDISWDETKIDLQSRFKPGDKLQVKILHISPEEMRVSCGIKQLTRSPWEAVREKYPPRSKVEGVISSITSFGIFVKLEDNIEGLVHTSEISRKRIDDIGAHFKIGDPVTALVLDVDVNRKKISLSMKSLEIITEKEELNKIMGGTVSNTASIADLLKGKDFK